MRRELCRFSESRDLWDWVHGMETMRRPVWVFAHNLGFDLTVSGFWDIFDSGRYSTRDVWPVADFGVFGSPKKRRKWRGTVVLTDPPTILSLRSAKGSLRLVDSCNYYFGPLGEMGKSLGLEQRPAPHRSAPDAVWFDRCEYDVTILERAVCGWIDRWSAMDCGTWKPTASGLGYSSWRKLLSGEKVIPDQSEKQVAFARGAYYGGQTEVFFSGSVWPQNDETDKTFTAVAGTETDVPRGPVYYLDVHSFYPSIMAGEKFPCKFLRYTYQPTLAETVARSQFELPIALVQIRSESETYPVRHKGRLIFATGDFCTWLAGPELIPAIMRNHVARVIEVAWYQPADLFSRFVAKWLAARRECRDRGDKAGEMFCKLIMNSLSGKFAQKKVVWADRPELAPLVRFGQWDHFDVDARKMIRFRSIAGCVQEHTGLGEGRDSFPSISAFITSYGRERMRNLRALCPPRSVIYQDTDSLMCLPSAFMALVKAGEVHHGEAGKLGIKEKWDWIELHGFKFYLTPDGPVCPGLKMSAEQTGPMTWKQERFERLSTILADYKKPEVHVIESDFHPAGSLGARTHGAGGWTDHPTLQTDEIPF